MQDCVDVVERVLPYGPPSVLLVAFRQRHVQRVDRRRRELLNRRITELRQDVETRGVTVDRMRRLTNGALRPLEYPCEPAVMDLPTVVLVALEVLAERQVGRGHVDA